MLQRRDGPGDAPASVAGAAAPGAMRSIEDPVPARKHGDERADERGWRAALRQGVVRSVTKDEDDDDEDD